jgi:hypothetical protein
MFADARGRGNDCGARRPDGLKLAGDWSWLPGEAKNLWLMATSGADLVLSIPQMTECADQGCCAVEGYIIARCQTCTLVALLQMKHFQCPN